MENLTAFHQNPLKDCKAVSRKYYDDYIQGKYLYLELFTAKNLMPGDTHIPRMRETGMAP